jgi:DNA-binding transcriptional MerR regulator
MNSEEFTETTGSVARLAGCTSATVRRYIALGLVDCAWSADGRRLLPRAAAARVRQVLVHRQANKTRRRR